MKKVLLTLIVVSVLGVFASTAAASYFLTYNQAKRETALIADVIKLSPGVLYADGAIHRSARSLRCPMDTGVGSRAERH